MNLYTPTPNDIAVHAKLVEQDRPAADVAGSLNLPIEVVYESLVRLESAGRARMTTPDRPWRARLRRAPRLWGAA